MKKIGLALIALFIFFGCQDDLQDSTPAFQGIKDGDELWRAPVFSVDIDFGGFLFEATRDFETIQLVTLSDTPGTYNLGGESASVGIYRDENGTVYSTANAPDPMVSLYPADGQIIIEDVENTEPKRITGTFWFRAYTADGINTVSFIQGVIYRAPLLGGLVVIDDQSVCLQATQALGIAQGNFNATDSSQPDYPDVCNAYKDALNAQINACGDSDGSTQAILDGLGDCM